MTQRLLPAALLLFLGLAAPAAARAQGPQWKPPTREMPMMPRKSDLRGDWLSSRKAWFQGVETISGAAPTSLRATGEARPGSDYLQMVRFTSGPLPVVVWSDRNGDNRADIVEIYKSGGVIIQVIDADFDGSANVMRVYDAGGKLLRQESV
jgi:hypothetical protein